MSFRNDELNALAKSVRGERPYVRDARIAPSHFFAFRVRQPDAEAPLYAGATTRTQFYALVREWRSDTAAVSVDARKFRHPAFQKIVAMGWPAVPLLLHEIEHTSGHFDVALREITGDDPVPTKAAGDMRRVVKAWLQWGRRKNIIW